jgi:hypothetical protein
MMALQVQLLTAKELYSTMTHPSMVFASFDGDIFEVLNNSNQIGM